MKHMARQIRVEAAVRGGQLSEGMTEIAISLGLILVGLPAALVLIDLF
jgi:hypothetical protein